MIRRSTPAGPAATGADAIGMASPAGEGCFEVDFDSSLDLDIDANEAALVWAATTEVFPELQDWVARRGHGGAAPYRRTEMEQEIENVTITESLPQQ